jgi:[ribosomal protein S5]-alanine N-acetyltransferase
MVFLETKRCNISTLQPSDAPFIFTLMNSPGWLQFIGDRGIRSIADARNYIFTGPMKSYRQYGFGLFLVQEKETGKKMGLCGLLKREQFDDIDLGFAFLPEYNGKGYARESAMAIMDFAINELKLSRLLAFTDANNIKSIQLLEKLGFIFEKMTSWPNAADLKLFTINFTCHAS